MTNTSISTMLLDAVSREYQEADHFRFKRQRFRYVRRHSNSGCIRTGAPTLGSGHFDTRYYRLNRGIYTLQRSDRKPSVADPIEVNLRNWEERATIHARDATGAYMLDRFRAGEDAPHPIEATELGDISGKRVLHLRCHTGQDTLFDPFPILTPARARFSMTPQMFGPCREGSALDADWGQTTRRFTCGNHSSETQSKPSCVVRDGNALAQ